VDFWFELLAWEGMDFAAFRKKEVSKMAEGRGINSNKSDQKSQDSETLRAGMEEITGIKKEDLERQVLESRRSLRSAIDWIQSNYGILIAAGLGVATVGAVTLWLNRRGGLRNFYEEESTNPTLH
jgi:hypothetical protein